MATQDHDEQQGGSQLKQEDLEVLKRLEDDVHNLSITMVKSCWLLSTKRKENKSYKEPFCEAFLLVTSVYYALCTRKMLSQLV